ncbi:YdjC-like protein [Variovorax paradoxus]|uniref:YdjC-like protein n=1 Tax=Variovorax paradoxus TaxID=34073 RepID=A0A0H2LQT9_VARPD|nr:YdjC-like protein [Variovorax paradoxus]
MCGYEGGIVRSTSVMFGMPNIDRGLRTVDRLQGSGSGETARGGRRWNPRAKSMCGYEGEIVWSTSVMFGMPNIDRGLRTAERLQGSGSGETARGGRRWNPRAKSMCGYEGGIVPSTSVMFGMPNIDGGLRAVDRRQRSGAANRRGEFDAGIPRAKSLCGYEGGIVPSTSAMFGMPNIDGGLRAVDRQQRSGAANRRGELDAGIPRAKSLCGVEGRID